MSVNQSQIVNPKCVSDTADVCAAVARIELEDDVCWGFALASPAFFDDFYHLSFAIFGVFGVAS